MLRFFTTIVVLGATLAATAAPALAQEGEFFEVTVRRGDSCARIAQRYYGDWRRYDVIIRYNPELQEGAPGGRCGPNLRPGVLLRLPRDPGAAAAPAEATPDARLTAARRDVQAREPEDADWRPASRGLGLFRGWRVNTLEASTAEVTFRDTSTVHMRENTLVIIYGGEARTARRQTTRARLERGTLRSRLGELRLDVDTPSSNASLDGGAAVVVVDEEGTSRVSNFDGGAARVRGATGGRVNVRPGYGSEVRRGRRPSRPRPLPPAPRWSEDGPTHFLGVVGAGGTLRGAWDPVPVARTYRVEVGLGDPGGAVLAATEVDAEVTRFELRGLPAGRYWARVSTIDAAFFEGRPSGPKRFELVHVDLRAPGAGATEDLEPDPSLAPRAPRTLVGSAIIAPEGFRCRRAGGDDTLD
ncbi:MAG: FecR domain-containing protein, partial [Myxococcota bacterium]